MCSEIFRSEVSLRLNDSSNSSRATVIVHEMHTDQLTSDRERLAGVELARELWRGGMCQNGIKDNG